MSSTRECAAVQERRIAAKFAGIANNSSGSGRFNKSDVMLQNTDMLIECKTCVKPKESFSIKKEWIEKLKQECYSMGVSNGVIAFNFNYDDYKDYYVIDDKLMRFLVEKLREEQNE